MTAPERIHHWQESQLSIARFYGGCSVHGAHYRIALDEPGTPLVRSDVLLSADKAKRHATRAQSVADQQTADVAQIKLID